MQRSVVILTPPSAFADSDFPAQVYTMAPVFSLVLDRDVNEDVALLYPELYKELTKVRSSS
jgi:hypothetical protein